MMVLAFLSFCNRPKGLGGLNDPWKFYLEELPVHLADARKDLEHESAGEILEEHWYDLFDFETPSRQRLLGKFKELVIAEAMPECR